MFLEEKMFTGGIDIVVFILTSKDVVETRTTFAGATLGIRIPHSRAWIGSEGFGIHLAPPRMLVGQFGLATLHGGVVKIIPCCHVAPVRSPVANWAVLDASFGAPPDVPP